MDDILPVSGTFEEHLQHLGSVFERLRKAGLRLKPFYYEMKYHYLGHVVSKAGIKPDPAKIEQVKLYPVPTETTKVRDLPPIITSLYLILFQ